MGLRSNFIRPFKYDPNFEEGFPQQALFFLARRPWEQTAIQVSEDQGFTYISRYQWCLWGDLWFYKFALTWNGRHRNPPRAETR